MSDDITYEPTRDHWTPYEPWMRDVLADDARTSRIDGGEESRMKWERRLTLGRPLEGVKVHPDDVPERPAEADLADMTRQRDALGRMADHNHDVAAKVKAERDEWKSRHEALRADVEEMRRGVGQGLWPDFKGILDRDDERGAK